MPFWSSWFKKAETAKPVPRYSNYTDILSGVIPIYSAGFGEDVFASDVVQQAVYSIVTELKKLDPVHVKTSGSDLAPVLGVVQNVLDAPNALMTTSDFIEKVAWNLLLNSNSWVYPIFDGSTLKALYPLQPSLVEFDTNYNGKGEVWVRFTFPNGNYIDLPYENVIHVRYKFAFSEFMGGNEQGHLESAPLLKTLELNEQLLRGLAKSLNMQSTVTGVVKLKQMHNYEDQLAAVKEFEQKLQANESGMLPVDISADYMPINKQVQLLDATTLEFIDKKILRTWGVSIPIVNGDYTKEQYEAFYQKTLEPIIKSIGQAFTKGIFTRHAAQGFNNKIVFYAKELIFMTTDQKINFFRDLKDLGGCYVNEYRTAFGMRPLPELEGVRMQSLNFVNAQYAKEYQVGDGASGEGANDGEQGTN